MLFFTLPPLKFCHIKLKSGDSLSSLNDILQSKLSLDLLSVTFLDPELNEVEFPTGLYTYYLIHPKNQTLTSFYPPQIPSACSSCLSALQSSPTQLPLSSIPTVHPLFKSTTDMSGKPFNVNQTYCCLLDVLLPLSDLDKGRFIIKRLAPFLTPKAVSLIDDVLLTHLFECIFTDSFLIAGQVLNFSLLSILSVLWKSIYLFDYGLNFFVCSDTAGVKAFFKLFEDHVVDVPVLQVYSWHHVDWEIFKENQIIVISQKFCQTF
ncbi:hypothetical protein GEMRC1_003258 [Eukaryota sp. GEM-RC1]